MGLSGTQASRSKQQEKDEQQALMSPRPAKHQDPSVSTCRMVRAEQGDKGQPAAQLKQSRKPLKNDEALKQLVGDEPWRCSPMMPEWSRVTLAARPRLSFVAQHKVPKNSENDQQLQSSGGNSGC